MELQKAGPKEFFLWAGALIALYASTGAFLALFFEYIDIAFPDSLNAPYDPYSTGIRFSIATLIVLFPVFLILMRVIRADHAKNPGLVQSWIRRWALYATLFLSGALIASDLIAVINEYLNGEITVHFFLKAILILLVASALFMHFTADLWGFWQQNLKKARSVAIAAGALVILTIAASAFIIGTPAQVRRERLDDLKVNDLSNIQAQVTSYYQREGTLPQSLSDLSDPGGYEVVPTDSEPGKSYSYRAEGPLSYELCADFNAPSNRDSDRYDAESWQHGAGTACFSRSVDPKRYPADAQSAQPASVGTQTPIPGER